eukprot:CAMPEP_0196581808 /NCGR_PEP_ID=MMETSP1081-20130531/35759_1 /TAXON_ID=36882 /ORGANISM="Pyramimonas amylifera, Strain CCMP720" /LENGTH=208 /DNA_ID=CAMNT_0041902173 /DNA_START=206 /DNA_END=832 /DNA_ORIENTATION=-
MDGDDTNNIYSSSPEVLPGEQGWWGVSASLLAKRLHLAFLKVCVKDLGVPYPEACEEFVQAAKAAYLSNYTLAEMQMALSMERGRTGVNEIDGLFSGRMMLPEEAEMRRAWIQLLYCTFHHCGLRFGQATAKVPLAKVAFDEKIQSFVGRVVEKACMGYDMNRIKLEQVWIGPIRDNFEAATFSQGLRLVYLGMSASNYHCPQELSDK